MMNWRSSSIIAGAAALLVAFTAVASAQNQTVAVALSPANEVPAVTADGTGTANITYNPTTMTLSWNITYTGLSGPALRGEIGGPAAATANGVAVFSLGNNMATPIVGSHVLSAPQAAQLLNGLYYVNIRTTDHRTGEIRGQIVLPTAP